MKIPKKTVGSIALIVVLAVTLTLAKGEVQQILGRLTSVSALVLCVQALPEYMKKDTSAPSVAEPEADSAPEPSTPESSTPAKP